MTTIPERIREEARAVRLKLCTEYICPPEARCGCMSALTTALLAAEKRGREEERERCARRFLTYVDVSAEGNNPIDICHVTGGLRAIRSTN